MSRRKRRLRIGVLMCSSTLKSHSNSLLGSVSIVPPTFMSPVSNASTANPHGNLVLSQAILSFPIIPLIANHAKNLLTKISLKYIYRISPTVHRAINNLIDLFIYSSINLIIYSLNHQYIYTFNHFIHLIIVLAQYYFKICFHINYKLI
jgi:hypothetical protein